MTRGASAIPVNHLIHRDSRPSTPSAREAASHAQRTGSNPIQGSVIESGRCVDGGNTNVDLALAGDLRASYRVDRDDINSATPSSIENAVRNSRASQSTSLHDRPEGTPFHRRPAIGARLSCRTFRRSPPFSCTTGLGSIATSEGACNLFPGAARLTERGQSRNVLAAAFLGEIGPRHIHFPPRVKCDEHPPLARRRNHLPAT